MELPFLKKRLDQRLDRLYARPHREKAPLAAILKHPRPGTRVAGRFQPSLARKRGEHARLRKRRLANARIAEQHGQLVRPTR